MFDLWCLQNHLRWEPEKLISNLLVGRFSSKYLLDRFSSKVVISLTSPKVMHQNVFLDLLNSLLPVFAIFLFISPLFFFFHFTSQIRSETAKILKATYPLAFNMTLAIFGNRLFDVCMIITYTLTTTEIKASTIFIVISLCNTLRVSFGWFFPQALQMYQETRISLKRLQVGVYVHDVLSSLKICMCVLHVG